MARVVKTVECCIFFCQSVGALRPGSIVSQLIVLVAVLAEDEQCTLGFTQLIVRVERCLIRYAILGCHFNVKLELGNKALLIPKPDNQSVIWFTSLHK